MKYYIYIYILHQVIESNINWDSFCTWYNLHIMYILLSINIKVRRYLFIEVKPSCI